MYACSTRETSANWYRKLWMRYVVNRQIYQRRVHLLAKHWRQREVWWRVWVPSLLHVHVRRQPNHVSIVRTFVYLLTYAFYITRWPKFLFSDRCSRDNAAYIAATRRTKITPSSKDSVWLLDTILPCTRRTKKVCRRSIRPFMFLVKPTVSERFNLASRLYFHPTTVIRTRRTVVVYENGIRRAWRVRVILEKCQ